MHGTVAGSSSGELGFMHGIVKLIPAVRVFTSDGSSLESLPQCFCTGPQAERSSTVAVACFGSWRNASDGSGSHYQLRCLDLCDSNHNLRDSNGQRVELHASVPFMPLETSPFDWLSRCLEGIRHTFLAKYQEAIRKKKKKKKPHCVSNHMRFEIAAIQRRLDPLANRDS